MRQTDHRRLREERPLEKRHRLRPQHLQHALLLLMRQLVVLYPQNIRDQVLLFRFPGIHAENAVQNVHHFVMFPLGHQELRTFGQQVQSDGGNQARYAVRDQKQPPRPEDDVEAGYREGPVLRQNDPRQAGQIDVRNRHESADERHNPRPHDVVMELTDVREDDRRSASNTTEKMALEREGI